MKSKYFDMIYNYYKLGVWDIEKVQNAVVKGYITEEEFEEITDIPYTPPNSNA